MIEKSYVIADMPNDLIGSAGRVLVEDVYAIAGLKKRKRSEIAVAINRQGVNIYDVCTPIFSRAETSLMVFVGSIFKISNVVCTITTICAHMPTMLGPVSKGEVAGSSKVHLLLRELAAATTLLLHRNLAYEI